MTSRQVASVIAALAVLLCGAAAQTAQTAQTSTVMGTVKSADEACLSFVVSPSAENTSGDITLIRVPDAVQWTREGTSCAFTSIGGKRLSLAPGTRAFIRYVATDGRNTIRWVVVRPENPMHRCIGQGGVTPAPDTLFAIDCDGIPPPECVFCPNPPYSSKARKSGVAGQLMFRVTILPDGSVTDVEMTRGLEKGLDENSLKTLRTWRFKPIPGPGGKPVYASSPISVTFRQGAPP